MIGKSPGITMECDSQSRTSVTPPPIPPSKTTVILFKSKPKTSASSSTTSRTILRPKISKRKSDPPPKPDKFQENPQDTPPILSKSPFRDQAKTSLSSSTTSRTIPLPKISKNESDPLPKPDPFQDEPQSTFPILSNLPFRVRKSEDLQNYDNSPDCLLHGVRRSSKFGQNQDKVLNFEPDISFETKKEVSDGSSGLGELKKPGPDEGIPAKNARKNLNLIGGAVSDSIAKRAKIVSEGNFVKLNINGYGRRKFTFKNKRKNFSSSSRRRRVLSRKGNTAKVEGEEVGLLDEEGLVVDARCKEDRLDFHNELIEEAVLRVRQEASEENLVKLLKLTHGYDSFRDGQLEAIKMVLCGKSTMLVLPTGAGKSLSYQLPALVLPGITLVVSPLVALMIDQLKQLPPKIPGGMLCSNQTAEEASETLRSLQEGAIKVLFVSPERFLNDEFISIFSGPLILSLVVVDEAHCVSEWSHNFRPSYMRLRASLLRDRLNAGCILAMTATATTRTLSDVMHALDIPSTNLVHSEKLRDNLHLSVSMSGNRIKDLMALLKSSRFSEIKSIIIYCKFQSETDMISKYLCDNSISAKSYHSGIPAKNRSRIQDLFCSNKIRVVVATVAFGMGLDKRDVGAVIHYSLPESLEEYVQEIGRAGRDGTLSYCHLLFDDTTYIKLRSLMHSDGVDEYAVNKLLCQIFRSGKLLSEEICSIVRESASRKFDMKEEVILTILTQLELGEMQYIRLLPQINVTCTLNFHQTSPSLLAAKDRVIAAILKKSDMKDGQYVFHIPSVANSIRMGAVDIIHHLKGLKFKGEITYELKDQAFCYTISDVPNDICVLASQLSKWLGEIEASKVRKIDAMFNAAVFAAKECDRANGCNEDQHTPCLQSKIIDYFNTDGDTDMPLKMEQNSQFLRADIKVFLQSNSHAKFTPRAVARILHGLSSPAFPSAIWSRTHFWGRYAHLDFKGVMEAAKQELMNFVGKDVS